MNVHTPERQTGESRADYAARRKESAAVNARNGRPFDWQPQPRAPGSMAVSPTLAALLEGHALPKLLKRESCKVQRAKATGTTS